VELKEQSDKFLKLGGLNKWGDPVVGRYLSGFMSNTFTSNPGASFMAARIYASIYPTWMLGQMNEDMFISITTSTSISPFLYVQLSKIQADLVGSRYPYAYDFFDPNY
jgi:hypothetical protein